MTLALEHLRQLGVPSVEGGSYTQEDAIRVLQGRSPDPSVADSVHGKMAWVAGQQLLNLLIRDAPDLGWIRDRIEVRTLLTGESSASFMSFPDGSHAVLVSRALQESLVGIANVLVYLDVATALVRSSRRRKNREKASRECAARVAASLRYLMLGHRMTGHAPHTPAVLDDESFEFAGRAAMGAVMFVIAHEIAHIVHGHSESSIQPYGDENKASISEVQELQADSWAVNLLAHLFAIDGSNGGTAADELALWSAFVATFATQFTEKAIYIRRNRTHPEAWARWAVIDETAAHSEDKADSLRLAFMASAAGAMKFDETFPAEMWPVLWSDETLRVEESVDLATLQEWDRLNTCSVYGLAGAAEQSATPAGRGLLAGLREGEFAEALTGIGISDRRIQRILDPNLALEFATLRSAFQGSSLPLTSGDGDLFSVAASRLAAEHLEGGFHP